MNKNEPPLPVVPMAPPPLELPLADSSELLFANKHLSAITFTPLPLKSAPPPLPAPVTTQLLISTFSSLKVANLLGSDGSPSNFEFPNLKPAPFPA